MTPTDETLAKLAYEAHREVVGRSTTVPWDELASASREAWRAASRAVRRAIKEPPLVPDYVP